MIPDFPPEVRFRGDMAAALGRAISEHAPAFEARIRAEEKAACRWRFGLAIVIFSLVVIGASTIWILTREQ